MQVKNSKDHNFLTIAVIHTKFTGQVDNVEKILLTVISYVQIQGQGHKAVKWKNKINMHFKGFIGFFAVIYTKFSEQVDNVQEILLEALYCKYSKGQGHKNVKTEK